jgi:dGTPase
VGLSDEVFQALKTLRRFNFERIYSDPRLKVESSKIRASFRYLFHILLDDYKKSGTTSILWRDFLHSKSQKYVEETKLEQKIIDFIAGMTDSYFMTRLQHLLIPQKILI